MKVGVNLWTAYGRPFPFPSGRLSERISERVLEPLSEMGVDGVELIVDEAENSVEELLTHQDQVRAILVKYRMAVPSLCTMLTWSHNLASTDEATRRRAVELAQGMCHVAKAYGAGAFLVIAGEPEPHTPLRLTWNNAIRSLRQVARTAEELDVLIGVENPRTSFLDTPCEMARFLADVNHPNVGCYLDPANGMNKRWGFPENWCTALAGRIVGVHIKGFDRERNRKVFCYEGDLDWSEVIPVLKECGYDGYLMVETPAPEAGLETGLEVTRRSVEEMRRFFRIAGMSGRH